MNKLIPVAIAVAVLLAAVLVLLRREPPHRAQAMEIAPPEAVLFAHLPDLRRTAQRWPETALARLWSEPEVQNFLKKPMEKMPALRRAREHSERLPRIAPREAFIAITALDGPAPRFVAGLSFSGSKSEVAALVAEPWAAWRKAWPAGRTEVLRQPRWEIETHVFEGRMLAGSFHAGWYFLANDLATLEATLARCSGDGSSGIASSAALQRAAGPLPSELDAFVFAQPSPLLEHLGARLSREPSKRAKRASESTPLAWGVRLEGTQIRDTIFAAGVRPPGTKLGRTTQTLTGPESLLFGSFLLPERMDLRPATSPLLAFVAASPSVAPLGEPVAWNDFTAAFGPEAGVVLDWPAPADAPSLSFVFQVRDMGRATALVESLTRTSVKGIQWQRSEHPRVTHFQVSRSRKGGTAPAVALTPEFLVCGAQAHAVRTIAERMRAGSPDLTQGPHFHEIVDRVKRPTAAFAYLDLGSVVERSYQMLRPFLSMSLTLSPDTSPYFDPAQLPAAETLGRHLGPSVFSQTARSDGIFAESVGSLSLSQTLAGIGLAAWISWVPASSPMGRVDLPSRRQPASVASDTIANRAIETQKPAENSTASENHGETAEGRASQR